MIAIVFDTSKTFENWRQLNNHANLFIDKTRFEAKILVPKKYSKGSRIFGLEEELVE